jgi:hypothetical protein
VVFHTAKIVLVVSAVVAVEIVVVTGPPAVKLQPPKVYPARAVVAVLASDAVDKVNAPAGSRVAVSVAGREEERVFPSKMMVGVSASVAEAGAPSPNIPEIDREIIAATAIGLLWILV